MSNAGRRPMGRLFYWGVWVVAVCIMQAASGAAATPQSGPATTTVTDTVYDATGNAANGTMIISWPAFTTAGGTQVAEGSTNATITSGVFSVALVPNVGATPAGVYYTVVFQLGPLRRCMLIFLCNEFLWTKTHSSKDKDWQAVGSRHGRCRIRRRTFNWKCWTIWPRCSR